MATEYMAVVRIRGMAEVICFDVNYTPVSDVYDFRIKTESCCKDDIPNGTVLMVDHVYPLVVFTEAPSFQKKLLSITSDSLGVVQEILRTPVEDIDVVKDIVEDIDDVKTMLEFT